MFMTVGFISSSMCALAAVESHVILNGFTKLQTSQGKTVTKYSVVKFRDGVPLNMFEDLENCSL